jgi:DNA-binding NarL/FixJ family response regulator
MSTAQTTAKGTNGRILIVDDHALVRRGLATLIGDERDLVVCGEAADTVEALAAVAALRPDLVIVDLSLKTGHGLDLIKQIRSHDERARILVLSMHDEKLFAERALRSGAMGYINKEEATGKVVEAIRQVLAGRVYVSAAMTERLLQRAAETGGAKPRLPSESLSDRELTVFQMIGQGVATREIAERLKLSIKTVETYREHIKAKLGLRNSAELSRHAAQWVLENT